MVYTTYKNSGIGDGLLLFYHALPTLYIVFEAITVYESLIHSYCLDCYDVMRYLHIVR